MNSFSLSLEVERCSLAFIPLTKKSLFVSKIKRGLQILIDSGPHALLSSFSRYTWNHYGPKTGFNASRNRLEDVRKLTSTDTPMIVDGGAHEGQTIDRFLEIFDDPTIHAFEPNQERANGLAEKYANTKVTIYNIALGPSSEMTQLNVAKSDASSSIHKPTTTNIEAFGERVSVRDSTTVQQERLDDVLDSEPDIVKLDVQGYEFEALKGCEQILDSVEVVLVESSFQELYDGQDTLCELNSFLRQYHFELFNLYDLYTANSGQLVEFDALYKRTK